MERWAVLCMCVRACVCMHINKAAFKTSLIYLRLHYGVEARSFSLSIYSSLPLPAHMWASIHMHLLFSRLQSCTDRPHAWRFRLPRASPNIYLTPEHTAGKVKRQFLISFTSWICYDVLHQGRETFCAIVDTFALYFCFTTIQMLMLYFLIRYYY